MKKSTQGKTIPAMRRLGIAVMLLLSLMLSVGISASAADAGQTEGERLAAVADYHTIKAATAGPYSGQITRYRCDSEKHIVEISGVVKGTEVLPECTVKVCIGKEVHTVKTIPWDKKDARSSFQGFKAKFRTEECGRQEVRVFVIVPGETETVVQLYNYFLGEETITVNLSSTVPSMRGDITDVSCDGTTLSFKGWAYNAKDPNETVMARVKIVTVDGIDEKERSTSAQKASYYHVEVPAGAGSNHGFEISLDTGGKGYLCAELYVYSQGLASEEIFCDMESIFASVVQYKVESLEVSDTGSVKIKGWVCNTASEESGSSIRVSACFNGIGTGTTMSSATADIERSDAAEEYGLPYTACGFELEVYPPEWGAYNFYLVCWVPQTYESSDSTTYQILSSEILSIFPTASSANQIGKDITVKYEDDLVKVSGYIQDPDSPETSLIYRVYVGNEIHQFRASDVVKSEEDGQLYGRIEVSFTTEKVGDQRIRIEVLDYAYSLIYGETLPTGFKAPEENATIVYNQTVALKNPRFNQIAKELSVTYSGKTVKVTGYIQDPDNKEAPLKYRVYVGTETHTFYTDKIVSPATINGRANSETYCRVDIAFSTRQYGKQSVNVRVEVLDYENSNLYNKWWPSGYVIPPEYAVVVWNENIDTTDSTVYVWEEGKEDRKESMDNLVSALYRAEKKSYESGKKYYVQLNSSFDCKNIPIYLSNLVDWVTAMKYDEWNEKYSEIRSELNGWAPTDGNRKINIELDLNNCMVYNMSLQVQHNVELTIKNGRLNGRRPLSMWDGKLTVENVNFRYCAGSGCSNSFNEFKIYQKCNNNVARADLDERYELIEAIFNECEDKDEDGGAIRQRSGELAVNNCTFYKCSSPGCGGAICSSAPKVLDVTNCCFDGNTTNNGGAIYVDAAGSATVVNCEFVHNDGQHGMAIHFYDTLMLADCTFKENGHDNMTDQCCIQAGGTLELGGIIYIDNYTPLGVYLHTNKGVIRNCGVESGSRVPITEGKRGGLPDAITHLTAKDVRVDTWYTWVKTNAYGPFSDNEEDKIEYFSASAFSHMENAESLIFGAVTLIAAAVCVAVQIRKRKGGQK